MTVGDKYRVVGNPYKYRAVWPGFVGDMDQYCGKVVTIGFPLVQYNGRLYIKIVEDGGRFLWATDFLIPLTQRSE